MPKIFISYRRADSETFALRIADRLAEEFGTGAVFIDVETLEGGEHFPKQLRTNLESADACVVVIGPRWSGAGDPTGERRLDLPTDYVRQEVSLALRREMKVIPVLVGGARMPTEAELPRDIRGLASLHAVVLTNTNFRDDLDRMLNPLRAGYAMNPILPAFAGPFVGSALTRVLYETTRPRADAGETSGPASRVPAAVNPEAVSLLSSMLFWGFAATGIGMAVRHTCALRTADVARIAALLCTVAGMSRLPTLATQFSQNEFNQLMGRFGDFLFWSMASSVVMLNASNGPLGNSNDGWSFTCDRDCCLSSPLDGIDS